MIEVSAPSPNCKETRRRLRAGNIGVRHHITKWITSSSNTVTVSLSCKFVFSDDIVAQQKEGNVVHQAVSYS